jgi:hypothetical protein
MMGKLASARRRRPGLVRLSHEVNGVASLIVLHERQEVAI